MNDVVGIATIVKTLLLITDVCEQESIRFELPSLDSLVRIVTLPQNIYIPEAKGDFYS